MLITNKAVYNMVTAPESTSVWVKSFFSDTAVVKRRISVENIKAISMSTMSNEFVLHIPSEYDYRFKSKDRVSLIHLIVYQCIAYQKQQNKKSTFRFYYHDKDKLDYAVQKRTDKKKETKKFKVAQFVYPFSHR